jgi:hypothetical protein
VLPVFQILWQADQREWSPQLGLAQDAAMNEAGGKDVGDEIDVAVHHQLLAWHKE